MIYQYPLFRSDENSREEACKYLAENMLKSGTVKVMEMNEDFVHQKFNKDQGQAYDFIKQMIADTCHFMYGVNASQMANYLLVSHMVDEKLRPALINYMKNVGLDFKIIDFVPQEIIHPYIANISSKPDFKPLERWDPRYLWDFDDDIVDPNERLMSPLNGFIHMTLYLKNIDNKNFLLSLLKNNIISKEQIVKANWKFDELELKLLPYNTFNKVLNIANAIFRYY